MIQAPKEHCHHWTCVINRDYVGKISPAHCFIIRFNAYPVAKPVHDTDCLSSLA